MDSAPPGTAERQGSFYFITIINRPMHSNWRKKEVWREVSDQAGSKP